MKLIVGLGNPGKAYASSRHNIGFRCINRLAKKHNIPVNRRQGRAQLGSGEIEGTEVLLVKPRTFMNRSGESVSLLAKRFNVPPNDILIIHDDLDLPLGKIRLRQEGSSGGHKGIDSIIDSLKSQGFPRIKVGISRPHESSQDVVDYVLGDFHPGEKAIIEETIDRVAEVVRCLLAEGITAAMNAYN